MVTAVSSAIEGRGSRQRAGGHRGGAGVGVDTRESQRAVLDWRPAAAAEVAGCRWWSVSMNAPPKNGRNRGRRRSWKFAPAAALSRPPLKLQAASKRRQGQLGELPVRSARVSVAGAVRRDYKRIAVRGDGGTAGYARGFPRLCQRSATRWRPGCRRRSRCRYCRKSVRSR